MRVLVDYRPALRERSGVGEYVHQFVRALLKAFSKHDLELSLISSSWKHRFGPSGEIAGATIVDRRVPGKLLNFVWHRLGWPPAELLAGRPLDVTHSPHPLLMPTSRAAQVITIHDLDFLAHPERTRAEIQRDYPALACEHARRADGIVVISQSTGRAVERQFGVPPDRITVCTPGAPPWQPRRLAPAEGYILFVGTLEPRKNVGGLLDAYEELLTRRRDMPRLVLAGKAMADAKPWLDRIARAPLSEHVQHIGYVDASDRRAVYEGARLLVQPSFDEGFGIPVLEAMTLGVPVVASDRSALPEVLGDAGPLVDPAAEGALASAIERLLDDTAFAAACASKGVERSRKFSWDTMARGMFAAYQRAIERRCA